MAAEIGLLSVTQIQKLSQSQHHHQNQPHQPNPNSTTTPSTSSSPTWMWNPKEHQEEDDSWEVRAFAEDTRNIMGTTWPPRSYSCTFCRREFRSAQALGGHMNVHRRDRARLHHHQPYPPPNPTSSSHPTSSFINIPPQERVANGGLCLLYHLPTSPNNGPLFSTHNHNTTLNACGKSPSTLLNVSSNPRNHWEKSMYTAEGTSQLMSENKHFSLEKIYEEQNIQQTNLMMMPTCSPSFDFPVAQAASNGFSSYCCSSSRVEEPRTSSTNHGHHEELDLELRLGHRSTPT